MPTPGRMARPAAGGYKAAMRDEDERNRDERVARAAQAALAALAAAEREAAAGDGGPTATGEADWTRLQADLDRALRRLAARRDGSGGEAGENGEVSEGAATVRIAPEDPADASALAAIHALHRACFPSDAEARLVDRLRADGDIALAFSASLPDASGDEERGEGVLVGHVVFSRFAQAPFPALALAPVSVAAPFRRRGIAARLIAAALQAARTADWRGVFVLGDPAYYGRFGFTAAAAAGFTCAYAGPYLQAMAPGGARLPATRGALVHAPAFAALE